MDELVGKVAVVTGAASGIGRGLAQRFAAEGMQLVLADIEADPLDAVASELRAGGVEVITMVTDVSDGEQVDALGDAVIDAFGAVHVVCNNAGVGGGGLMQDLTTADWQWVLGVNLWGVIHGMRVFLPKLLAQGEGHIVNTASLAGLVADAVHGSVQRQQVRGRRHQRDDVPGAAPDRVRRRDLGAVPRLGAHPHRRVGPQPARRAGQPVCPRCATGHRARWRR